MQSWTPILIILLGGLGWLIWIAYGRLLLNKAAWVKRINPAVLKSVGDIKVKGDLVEIMFLWGINTFPVSQIKQVKAYAQTSWGLEEYEQVDFQFDTADKITFNASMQEHRDFIQSITRNIGIADTVWTWGFLPYLGDKMGRDLIFKKNGGR